MAMIGFILGLLLGGIAWQLERWRYDKLWEDYRKILNEFSVRTGGKPIYRPEKTVGGTITPVQENLPRIITPDMAETEAEAEWQKSHEFPTLTPEDMKHLGMTF